MAYLFELTLVDIIRNIWSYVNGTKVQVSSRLIFIHKLKIYQFNMKSIFKELLLKVYHFLLIIKF